MTASLELLLAAGIVAFYLQDATLLLHFDEIVFTRTRAGWRASAGGLQWGGRFLFVANPLTPARPLLRGSWLSADTGAASAPEVPSFAPLRPFGWLAGLLWLQQLLVLPVLLLAYPHPLALLAAFALVYATVLLLAAMLWRRRAHLALDRRACGALALECLLCPPHAINIVRKLGLRRGMPGDALAFAAQVLDADAMRALGQPVTARLDLVEGGGAAPADREARGPALRRTRERLAAAAR